MTKTVGDDTPRRTTFLERIEARRASAVKRLAKAKNDVLRLEGEVADMDDFLQRFRGPSPIDPPKKLAEVRAGNPSKFELIAAVHEILSEAGKPVTRRDLLLRLAAKGRPMGGKNPEMNLTMALRRSAGLSNVVHRLNVGYWFADRPYPEDILPVPSPTR